MVNIQHFKIEKIIKSCLFYFVFKMAWFLNRKKIPGNPSSPGVPGLPGVPVGPFVKFEIASYPGSPGGPRNPVMELRLLFGSLILFST